jgi:hypothetical protein
LPYPLKVVPPLHVAQIERGKSAANGAAGLKRRSGSRQVTGSQCEVSDSHVADGQVVLPAGVARVGVSKLLILAEHDSRKGRDGRQVAGVQQPIDLQVSDHGPRALGLGDEHQQLGVFGQLAPGQHVRQPSRQRASR